MPKYLFTGSFTSAGLAGLIKEGGTGRRQAVQRLMESLGGKLESYYFAFGEIDFFIVAELPDGVSATAGSLTAGASGAVNVKTTVLIPPEEMDQATQKSADYRPPGR